MKTNIFILVPSFERTGPIKGAVAIANMLSKSYHVTFVTLKNKKGIENELDQSINRIDIHSSNWNLFKWIFVYRKILKQSAINFKTISISLCFSADIVNGYAPKSVINITSIRANLIKDYRFSFGFKGYFFSFFHLFFLHKFKKVITMTNQMSSQIKRITNIDTEIIGNFIDEKKIKNLINVQDVKKKNYEKINLIFVGSLTNRKKPMLLAETIYELKKKGIDLNLTYVGDGPLKKNIKNFIKKNNLQKNITLTGKLEFPYLNILNSDYFILPSESEGISRAALEALYLGIPCLLRDIDGNRELVKDNENGFLFKSDKDFISKLLLLINLKKKNMHSLVPIKFSQTHVEKKYIKLINKLSLSL